MVTLETVMTQMFVAFGQGAGFGSIQVSPDTLERMRQDYEPRVALELDRWPDLAPTVLQWCWRVGNEAAGVAAQAAYKAGVPNPYGKDVIITIAHYERARRKMLLTSRGRTPGAPLEMCPCAPVQGREATSSIVNAIPW